MDNAHILLKQQQGDIFALNPDSSRSENMFQNPKTNKTTKLDKFNSTDIPELPGTYPKKNIGIVHETAGANLHNETLPNPVEYITEKLNNLASTIESITNKGDIEDFKQHLKENIEDSKTTKSSVGSIETLDSSSNILSKLPNNIAGIKNMPNKSKSSKLKNKKRIPQTQSPKVTPTSNPSAIDEKIKTVPLNSVVVDPTYTSDKSAVPPTSLNSGNPLNSTLSHLVSEAGDTPIDPKKSESGLLDPLTPQFVESASIIPEVPKQCSNLENGVDIELRNDAQPSTHQPLGIHENLGKIDARRQSLDVNSPDYEPYKYSPSFEPSKFDKESPKIIQEQPVDKNTLTDSSPFPSKPNKSRKIEEGSLDLSDLSGVSSLPPVIPIESPKISSKPIPELSYNENKSTSKDLSGVTTLPAVTPVSVPDVTSRHNETLSVNTTELDKSKQELQIKTETNLLTNREFKSKDATLNTSKNALPVLSSVTHQPTLDPKEYSSGVHGTLDTLDGEPEMAILDTIKTDEKTENKSIKLRNPNTDMVHVQATEVQYQIDESGPKTSLHSVDKSATSGGGIVTNPRHLNTESNYVKDTKHASVLNTNDKSAIETIPSDTPSLVQSQSDIHNSTGLSPSNPSESLGYQFKTPILQRKIAPGIPFSGHTVGDSLVGYTYLQDALDLTRESKSNTQALKNIDSNTNTGASDNLAQTSIEVPTLKKEYSRNSIKGDGTDKIAPGIPFSGSTVADSLIGYTYHSHGKLNNNESNQSNIDMNTNRSMSQLSNPDPVYLSSALGDSGELRTHHSKPSSDGNLEPEFIATYTRVGEELNEIIQPHQYQIIDSKENPLEPIDDVNIPSPSAQQKLLPDSHNQNSRTNTPVDSSIHSDLNNKTSPILVRDSDPTHREAIVIEMKDPQISSTNQVNVDQNRNISNSNSSKVYLKGQAVNEPANVTLGKYNEDSLYKSNSYNDSSDIGHEDDGIPVKKTSSITIVSESLATSLGNYLA